MCRFLAVRFNEPASAEPWLEAFAAMAEASRTLDGDRQGDGWGMAWLDGIGSWRSYHSLAPVWREGECFRRIPSTSHAFVVHARSASFLEDKGEIAYNQPYLRGGCAFAFNGLLKGVRLPFKTSNRIGAQKVASLVQGLLARHEPGPALERAYSLLLRSSAGIPALNLLLMDPGGRAAVLSHFEEHPAYYRLHSHEAPGALAVCSEPLAGREWTALPDRRVHLL